MRITSFTSYAHGSNQERSVRSAPKGWPAVIRQIANPEEMLKALRAFIAEHGRRPRTTKTAAASERSLGVWATNQNSRRSERPGSSADVRRTEVRQLLESVPTFSQARQNQTQHDEQDSERPTLDLKNRPRQLSSSSS
ncbi:helicase associated domain-containing protein [Pseudarthrobacter sp. PH31-O2]|uniref:helicase associated domain-containing protein n=1 Tax=Pseudarthrobacter sp. PH31-O2 TaxID=3046206 RepID=UPI0024BBE751|nr:helicase associated domain-containing protein [Pseudarthrobacter sp. PH31-O2]MDJ0353375.1 helicase associated domain-containing protein [Pseudarthrobacter sp. PH31-O2]